VIGGGRERSWGGYLIRGSFTMVESNSNVWESREAVEDMPRGRLKKEGKIK